MSPFGLGRGHGGGKKILTPHTRPQKVDPVQTPRAPSCLDARGMRVCRFLRLTYSQPDRGHLMPVPIPPQILLKLTSTGAVADPGLMVRVTTVVSLLV